MDEFLDAEGRPRPLPVQAEDDAPSFERLVSSVTADIRPRAVLDGRTGTVIMIPRTNLVARSDGKEIGVEKILVRDGAASGVVLAGGEEIQAKVVVSGNSPAMAWETPSPSTSVPPRTI